MRKGGDVFFFSIIGSSGCACPLSTLNEAPLTYTSTLSILKVSLVGEEGLLLSSAKFSVYICENFDAKAEPTASVSTG